MNRLILLIVLAAPFVCGCRAVQSEVQKAEIRAAGRTAVVGGVELRLDSVLKRTPNSDKMGFDLSGRLVVSSGSGSLPQGARLDHFALKPSWKGWPGYYPMNFTLNKGRWVLRGAYGDDPSFSATSRQEEGQYVVEFSWRNLGRGIEKKPEHFASYDVSVSMLDLNGKRYVLSQLQVPTD